MTHWYDLETGKPCHTIIGKNGKERARNIKDAREYNNVPSVTGIIGRLDKPWLSIWKSNQILDAVLSMESKLRPALKTQEPDKWRAIILEEADKTRKTAEIGGNHIHKEMENYFLTGKYSEEGHPWIAPAIQDLENSFGKRRYLPEHTFASPVGYGGSIDLVCLDNPIIIDFKGKSDRFFIAPKSSDDHLMQLAAYKYAMFQDQPVQCCNLYINYEIPGVRFLHIWDMKEIEKGWEMFKLLLEFWKLENNFYV